MVDWRALRELDLADKAEKLLGGSGSGGGGDFGSGGDFGFDNEPASPLVNWAQQAASWSEPPPAPGQFSAPMRPPSPEEQRQRYLFQGLLAEENARSYHEKPKPPGPPPQQSALGGFLSNAGSMLGLMGQQVGDVELRGPRSRTNPALSSLAGDPVQSALPPLTAGQAASGIAREGMRGLGAVADTASAPLLTAGTLAGMAGALPLYGPLGVKPDSNRTIGQTLQEGGKDFLSLPRLALGEHGGGLLERTLGESGEAASGAFAPDASPFEKAMMGGGAAAGLGASIMSFPGDIVPAIGKLPGIPNPAFAAAERIGGRTPYGPLPAGTSRSLVEAAGIPNPTLGEAAQYAAMLARKSGGAIADAAWELHLRLSSADGSVVGSGLGGIGGRTAKPQLTADQSERLQRVASELATSDGNLDTEKFATYWTGGALKARVLDSLDDKGLAFAMKDFSRQWDKANRPDHALEVGQVVNRQTAADREAQAAAGAGQRSAYKPREESPEATVARVERVKLGMDDVADIDATMQEAEMLPVEEVEAIAKSLGIPNYRNKGMWLADIRNTLEAKATKPIQPPTTPAGRQEARELNLAEAAERLAEGGGPSGVARQVAEFYRNGIGPQTDVSQIAALVEKLRPLDTKGIQEVADAMGVTVYGSKTKKLEQIEGALNQSLAHELNRRVIMRGGAGDLPPPQDVPNSAQIPPVETPSPDVRSSVQTPAGVQPPRDPLAGYKAEKARLEQVLDTALERGMDMSQFRSQQEQLDRINRAIQAIERGSLEEPVVPTPPSAAPDANAMPQQSDRLGLLQESPPKPGSGLPPQQRQFPSTPNSTTGRGPREPNQASPSLPEFGREPIPINVPDYQDIEWRTLFPRILDKAKSRTQSVDNLGGNHPALREGIARAVRAEQETQAAVGNTAEGGLLPEIYAAERDLQKQEPWTWTAKGLRPSRGNENIDAILSPTPSKENPAFAYSNATLTVDAAARRAVGINDAPKIDNAKSQRWLDLLPKWFAQTGEAMEEAGAMQRVPGGGEFPFVHGEGKMPAVLNDRIYWMNTPGDQRFERLARSLGALPENVRNGWDPKSIMEYFREFAESPEKRVSMENPRGLHLPDYWTDPADNQRWLINRSLAEMVPSREYRGSLANIYYRQMLRANVIEEFGQKDSKLGFNYINPEENREGGLLYRIGQESGPAAQKDFETLYAALSGNRQLAGHFSVRDLGQTTHWGRAGHELHKLAIELATSMAAAKQGMQPPMETAGMFPGYLPKAKGFFSSLAETFRQLLNGVSHGTFGVGPSPHPEQVVGEEGLLINRMFDRLKPWKKEFSATGVTTEEIEAPRTFTGKAFATLADAVAGAAAGLRGLIAPIGKAMDGTSTVNHSVAAVVGEWVGRDNLQFAVRGKLREVDFIQMLRNDVHPDIVAELRKLNDAGKALRKSHGLTPEYEQVMVDNFGAENAKKAYGRVAPPETQYMDASLQRLPKLVVDPLVSSLLMFMRYSTGTMRHTLEALQDLKTIVFHPNLSAVEKADNVAALLAKHFVRSLNPGTQLSGELQRLLSQTLAGRDPTDMESENGLRGRIFQNFVCANYLGPLWMLGDYLLKKGGYKRSWATRNGREDFTPGPQDMIFTPSQIEKGGELAGRVVGAPFEKIGLLEKKLGHENEGVLDAAQKLAGRVPVVRAGTEALGYDLSPQHGGSSRPRDPFAIGSDSHAAGGGAGGGRKQSNLERLFAPSSGGSSNGGGRKQSNLEKLFGQPGSGGGRKKSNLEKLFE